MAIMAYIGFGANLGNREATFHKALETLSGLEGITVCNSSKLYDTEPVNLSDGGPRFLNAAIEIETELSPKQLASKMREVELCLGKSREHRSDISRVIDLDLLLFGNEIVRDEGLEVPHPRMHQRGFVLVPLAEIAPDVLHPMLKHTIDELVSALSQKEIGHVTSFRSSVN